MSGDVDLKFLPRFSGSARHAGGMIDLALGTAGRKPVVEGAFPQAPS